MYCGNIHLHVNVHCITTHHLFFSDQIIKDGQFYDFDPNVDELFETSKEIVAVLDPKVIDREGNTSSYEDLLKLLHVFVLPEICFLPKDREQVQIVLETIERQHDQIERDIDYKDRVKKNTETSLAKQRENILRTENLKSQQYLASCDKEFLQIFLKHIEKDLRKLNEIYTAQQEQINPLRDSVDERDIIRLREARAARGELLKSIERSTVVREEIKNCLYRPHVKKRFSKVKGEPVQFHLLYVEVSKRLDGFNAEIRDMINAKIKVSSVREAVLLTLHELDSDGRSVGFNRKKGTFETEADLFDPGKKPEEWATLNEKVKAFLVIKQAGYRTKYTKFCTLIKQKCQQLFDESKLFARESDIGGGLLSPTDAEFIHLLGSESLDRRSNFQRNTQLQFQPPTDYQPRQRTFSSRWSMGSISKGSCEGICKEVTEHITEMANILAIEIMDGDEKKVYPNFVNKVYTCYEQHVAEELMPVLCELYEASYRRQCDSLFEWISRYSMSEIGCGEQTIARVCQYLPQSDEPGSSWEDSIIVLDESPSPPPPCSGAKADTFGGLDLKDVPINMLYEKFNNQAESMSQSFVGALDMPCLDEYLDIQPDGSVRELSSTGLPAERPFLNYMNNETSSGLPCDNNSDVDGVFLSDEEQQKLSEQQAAGRKRSGAFINGTDHRGDMNHKGSLDHRETDTLHVQEAEMRRKDSFDSSKNMDSGHLQVPGVEMRRKTSANSHKRIETFRTSGQRNKEKFYNIFADFFGIIDEEDTSISLFSKLRNLTRAVNVIQTQMAKLQGPERDSPCADELLDILILLLCHLDAARFLRLYAHLNLLIHLCPLFMVGNAHDYSLVTVHVAYQHLFEQQVLHRNTDTVAIKKR